MGLLTQCSHNRPMDLPALHAISETRNTTLVYSRQSLQYFQQYVSTQQNPCHRKHCTIAPVIRTLNYMQILVSQSVVSYDDVESVCEWAHIDSSECFIDPELTHSCCFFEISQEVSQLYIWDTGCWEESVGDEIHTPRPSEEIVLAILWVIQCSCQILCR